MIFVRATTKDGLPALEIDYPGPRGGKRREVFPVVGVKWDADSYPLKDFFKDKPSVLVSFSSSCDHPKDAGWDMRRVRLWPREMVEKAVALPTHCPTCG